MTIPILNTRVASTARPALMRNHHRPATDIMHAYTRQGIDGDDARDKHPADQYLAKQIFKALNHYFPDHLWRVEVSHKQGIATIRLMGLSDVPYVLKIEDLKVLSGHREVMRAGGELLERFKMPRSGFKTAEWNSAVRKWKPHLTRRKHPNLIGAI